MTIAISSLALQHVEVEVGFVGRVAFRVQHRHEVEAAGGADRSLEGADQRRIFPARLNGNVRAFFEAEACNVDRVAARVLGNLASSRAIAQPADIGRSLIDGDDAPLICRCGLPPG